MVLSTPSTHETKSKHTRIKVFSIIVSKHKKALMLCMKAFPCSLGYESNQTEEEEKARVEVYRWNETYNMMLKSMKLKRKD